MSVCIASRDRPSIRLRDDQPDYAVSDGQFFIGNPSRYFRITTASAREATLCPPLVRRPDLIAVRVARRMCAVSAERVLVDRLNRRARLLDNIRSFGLNRLNFSVAVAVIAAVPSVGASLRHCTDEEFEPLWNGLMTIPKPGLITLPFGRWATASNQKGAN